MAKCRINLPLEDFSLLMVILFKVARRNDRYIARKRWHKAAIEGESDDDHACIGLDGQNYARFTSNPPALLKKD